MKRFADFFQFREFADNFNDNSDKQEELLSLAKYAAKNHPGAVLNMLKQLSEEDTKIASRLKDIQEDGLSLKDRQGGLPPDDDEERDRDDLILPNQADEM